MAASMPVIDTKTSPVASQSPAQPPFEALPHDVYERIFSLLFIPTKPIERYRSGRDENLHSLSKVSKTFDRATRQYIYATPFVNAPSGIPLLSRTLMENPALGRTVRGLKLQFDDSYEPEDGVLRGLFCAVKSSLEELSFYGVTTTCLLDLLSVPVNLKLVDLRWCTFSNPVTKPDYSPPPPPITSIRFLSFHECKMDCNSVPPECFTSLITLSFFLSPEDFGSEGVRFLLDLPRSLRALRIHLQPDWVDDEVDGGISRYEWKEAFEKLVNLERLEINVDKISYRRRRFQDDENVNRFQDDNDDDGGDHGRILEFSDFGLHLRTLVLIFRPSHSVSITWIKSCLESLKTAPQVQELVILKEERRPRRGDKGKDLKSLEKWWKEEGSSIAVDIQVALELREEEYDPFWKGLEWN